MQRRPSGTMLPVIGIQAITDGTSNTGLFSERLLSLYPYRHRHDGLSPGNQRLACGIRRTFSAAQTRQQSPTTRRSCSRRAVVRICGLDRDDTFKHRGRADDGRSSGFYTQSSYMHWTAPNSVSCSNALDSPTTALSVRGHRSLWLSFGEQLALWRRQFVLRRRFGALHQVVDPSANLVGARYRAMGEVISSDQY